MCHPSLFLGFPTGHSIGNHSFCNIKTKPNNFLAQGRQEIILLCLNPSEPPQSREVLWMVSVERSLFGGRNIILKLKTQKNWNPVHSQNTVISWNHHGTEGLSKEQLEQFCYKFTGSPNRRRFLKNHWTHHQVTKEVKEEQRKHFSASSISISCLPISQFSRQRRFN